MKFVQKSALAVVIGIMLVAMAAVVAPKVMYEATEAVRRSLMAEKVCVGSECVRAIRVSPNTIMLAGSWPVYGRTVTMIDNQFVTSWVVMGSGRVLPSVPARRVANAFEKGVYMQL